MIFPHEHRIFSTVSFSLFSIICSPVAVGFMRLGISLKDRVNLGSPMQSQQFFPPLDDALIERAFTAFCAAFQLVQRHTLSFERSP
jgi:hypothetical protein